MAAMLFQTGSSRWDAGAHGAKGLFAVSTCSLSLLASSPLPQGMAPQPGGQCPVSGLGIVSGQADHEVLLA